MIEVAQPEISLRRPCELTGPSRSTYYYQPATESPFSLLLMRLIDPQYTKTPFYGYPKVTEHLRRSGYAVNPKGGRRLMRLMDIQAVHSKRRTSVGAKGYRVYPYLLRGLAITQPNQVWCSDVAYRPMGQDFMYLVAIMDWFSRYVLTWQLSNTLDSLSCLMALHQALDTGVPEIFNTDQGAQFTGQAFTTCPQEASIRISMDGRGRAVDNIVVERLWRTVKYGDVCLKEYATVRALYTGLEGYFGF